MRKTAFLLMTLVMTAASAQEKPTSGYAPVPAERSEGNEIGGLKVTYEVHGPDKPGFGKSGEPVVLPSPLPAPPHDTAGRVA